MYAQNLDSDDGRDILLYINNKLESNEVSMNTKYSVKTCL
jgi:hypothetical protein